VNKASHRLLIPFLVLYAGSLWSYAQTQQSTNAPDEVEALLRATRAQAEMRRAIGAEVEKLFRDDQALGSPELMSDAQRRSWEVAHEKRVLRMREIVRAEQLETIPDLNNAALLLQHGIAPEDFLTAHVLFSTAALKGSMFARWGAAAALDRYLAWIGRPSIFRVSEGAPNLFGDDIRKFHCMLSVAEQREDAQNRQLDCPLTVRDVYNNGRPNQPR
jgi:hypothetical protein